MRLSVFWLQSKSLAWVFLAYGLGGVSIGTFEANLLSCITPLGHRTKLWATLGIPLGVSSVLILGFGLMSLGVHPRSIYVFVGFVNMLGMLIFLTKVPSIDVKGNGDSFQAMLQNFREWREWLPLVRYALSPWSHGYIYTRTAAGVK